jgi:hypothetical protein
VEHPIAMNSNPVATFIHPLPEPALAIPSCLE